MTCQAILSYPTHFITTVSSILTTFFSTIFAILDVFFNMILPWLTAIIIIVAILFGCVVVCAVVAEGLGSGGAEEKEKEEKRKKMQGQGTGYSGSKVKGDWSRSRSRGTSAVDGMDDEIRLRFELQILEELLKEKSDRLWVLGGDMMKMNQWTRFALFWNW